MFEYGSELVDLVLRRALPHATSRSFDAAAWDRAHAAIAPYSRRDDGLLATARLIGDQLFRLRSATEGQLSPLGRRRSRILALAMVNREHEVMAERQLTLLRRAARDGGAVDVETVSRVRMRGGMEGNDLAVDDLTDNLVDALPHWLAAAEGAPETGRPTADEAALGRRALQAFTIESGLTMLWQQALWSGWHLEAAGAALRFVPGDRKFETLRHAWLWRQQAVLHQAGFRDMARDAASRRSGGEFDLVLERIVVGIDDQAGRPRRFRSVRATASSKRRVAHVLEASALRSSYLSPFLDTELREVGLTAWELFRAWLVLADVAEVLAGDLPRRRLVEAANVRRWALVTRTDRLREAVRECCGLGPDATARALTFLTYDPSARGVFRKGLWSMPMVPVSATEVALCLRIPMQAGRVFRSEAGQRSDLMSATIPI